jgi:hypothetical protein
MLEEFDVDEAALRRDLHEHLQRMLAAGLIRRVVGGS